MKVKDIELPINGEVWGYTGPVHTVLNTDYQQLGEVVKTADSRYRARVAGRADHTGGEDYFDNYLAAVAFAELDPEAEVSQLNPFTYKAQRESQKNS